MIQNTMKSTGTTTGILFDLETTSANVAEAKMLQLAWLEFASDGSVTNHCVYFDWQGESGIETNNPAIIENPGEKINKISPKKLRGVSTFNGCDVIKTTEIETKLPAWVKSVFFNSGESQDFLLIGHNIVGYDIPVLANNIFMLTNGRSTIDEAKSLEINKRNAEIFKAFRSIDQASINEVNKARFGGFPADLDLPLIISEFRILDTMLEFNYAVNRYSIMINHPARSALSNKAAATIMAKRSGDEKAMEELATLTNNLHDAAEDIKLTRTIADRLDLEDLTPLSKSINMAKIYFAQKRGNIND